MLGELYLRTLIYSSYVIFGGISFGVLAPFVKLAYEKGIPTSDSVCLQFFVGFLLLFLINLMFVRYRMGAKTFIKLLLSGIPMALTTTFYYNSLQYLDASISIVLLFQYTWMGIIIELILDRVKPTWEKIGAAVILFVGSLFAVNIFGADVSSFPVIGFVWGLLSALSFTAFLYVSGRVANYVPALRKSLVMAFGAVIVIAFVFPVGDFASQGVSLPFVGLGLTLGLFGVVLPPLLFSLGIPVVGSGLGTILSSTELPTTMILSAIVVSEHVSFLQWFGIMIILSGIVLANYPVHRKEIRV